MPTSAFKSTSKRPSIGASTPQDSSTRSLRRSRSLSCFSRPTAPDPDDYIRDLPSGKFVNTTRGSAAPFPGISLDDLALDFFSSSSKNESDGGGGPADREGRGRSASRRGEIGRWASDTASSRRRGRSVSRGRNEAVPSSSAASGPKNAVTSDVGSRKRRSVSVARSCGNVVPIADKDTVADDSGTRRRRSLSVARYQISDSESDIGCARNPSNRATMVAPTGGNTQLPLLPKATASSYHRPGSSKSDIDLSLIHDDYSSQSSALTDDESKDTYFGKNGFEKIIRAVHAQKKVDHPSEEVANGGLYDAMRKELRHAVEEIRTELNQSRGRNQTALASEECFLLSENSKTQQDSFRIREKYAKKIELLEKRKKNLLTEMLLEEQCDRGFSQNYEELPGSRDSDATEKLPRARKRSSDRSRMSERLIEDAERYFDDFISNIEDTDLSSFDGERSDGSSTLGGIVKRRDFAIGEAESCRTPAGSNSRRVEMDGIILPWLQWETGHDSSPCGKTNAQTPTTPKAVQRNSEKESSQMHDPSSYTMSSHGSWSPSLYHSSPMDKREEEWPKQTGTDNDCVSRFDMDEYLNLQKSEELLFETYREQNRISMGGLLLCAGGGLH